MKQPNATFEFELGQVVLVDGIQCRIKEREIYDGKPDYLLVPKSFSGLTKSGHELPGWIRPENIEVI